MKFGNFIGVRFIQDLIAQKYNQDFMDIRQWWDDHNSGTRVWDIVSATLGYFGNGTVSLPSITFASDTDTGWYRIGANNPGLSAGGTKVIDAKSTGVAILGTTTNDSAAAGFIGEYMSSVVAAVAPAATGVYQDTTTLSLTAGDWDTCGQWGSSPGSATAMEFGLSIGTAGNAFSDQVYGDNRGDTNVFAGNQNVQGWIVGWRVSTASAVTLRMKTMYTYAGAAPSTYGRITARRVR